MAEKGNRLMASWTIAVLIALFLLWAPHPAAAQPAPMDCGDFWRDGAPSDASGGAFPCYEYDPADPTLIVGPGRNYRIFYTAEWHVSARPEAAPFLEAIAQGFDRSVRHYRDLGLRVDPIYFMVSENLAEVPSDIPFVEYDWDVLAEVVADWAAAGEPCPATSFGVAFASIREGGADVIKQLTAHEVFHCVQWFNFSDELPMDVDNDWLAESTAEYFSGAVYPCVNFEHRFSVAYNPDTDVLSQSYENVVLLQHLSVRGGLDEPGILSIIRNQPRGGGTRAEQQAAFARTPGMSEKFHEFGKDFVDNEVPDCAADGRMPVRRDFGPLETVGAHATIELSAAPLTVTRKRVKFEPGKRYKITKTDRAGEGRLSWRKYDNTDSWEQIPGELTTECEGENIYQIVATTTPEDDQEYRAEIEFEADEEADGPQCCIDTGEHDRCLVGAWRADDSAIEQWLRQVFMNMNTPGSTTTLKTFGADVRFSADEAGGVNGSISDVSATGDIKRVRPSGGTDVTEFEFAGGGETTSRWSTERNRTLHICPRTSSVAFTMTVTGEFGSMTMPLPVGADGGGSGDVAFEYQCSGGRLTITHRPPGLPPQVYGAQKIGSE